MAILTASQLTEIRQNCAREIPVNYTKPQVNLAIQAIENWFEISRVGLNAAINTATVPFVFTPIQKLRLVKYWLQSKFGRE